MPPMQLDWGHSKFVAESQNQRLQGPRSLLMHVYLIARKPADIKDLEYTFFVWKFCWYHIAIGY